MAAEKDPNDSKISKFYSGKSVFMTGAAGYLGVVILETLLRCCPGIKNIFLLLRSKNGVKPEDRKAQIFKKEIFDKLKEDDPDAFRKVVIIPGDITHDNLGISENDLAKITKEVSIVIHCAATVSFFKSLSFMMTHNVVGTDNIIDFCHKLDKIEALVYSSTLYSNSNRKDIDEKVYKMPLDAKYLVSLSRKGDDKELNHLFSNIDPQFPNFYTFSKCVAENLLQDKAYDLPVCIVRPSVITCCIKGSMPGYIESGSAIVNLSIGIGKGFIRIGPVYDEDMNLELISGDAAANTHIVAACIQATEGLPSPTVYNCTSGRRIHWRDWMTGLMKCVIKHPIPHSYLIPSMTFFQNPVLFKVAFFLCHYLPAYMIDIFLWMAGSKISLVKKYKFYERCSEKAKPFLAGKWKFQCKNFNSLPDKLTEADTEMFCVDMSDFSVEKLAECLRFGCPVFRVNNKPYEEHFGNTLLRYFLTYLMRCTILGSIVAVFYVMFLKG